MKLKDPKRVPVAVIGAGGWGKNIIRTLAGLASCDLKYVCDLKPQMLIAARNSAPHVRTTLDLVKVLQDERIKAVFIAVDAPAHHKIAAACLTAGKHVFVEKPLTLSIEDSTALIGLATERKLKLMVGHLLLYHPAVTLLKELIDSGEIGQVRYMYSQRSNLGVVKQDENAWWSLAPHDISVAQFLLGGKPTEVSATGACFLQPDRGIEDVVFASIRFDDGAMANVHVSWLDPHKIRRITIVGSKKMVVFDDMEGSEKLRIYDKGAEVLPGYVDYAQAIRLRVGDIHSPAVPSTEPLELELRHFLAAVAQDLPIRSDGPNGLDVVKVLVAGDHSLKLRGAVTQIAR